MSASTAYRALVEGSLARVLSTQPPTEADREYATGLLRAAADLAGQPADGGYRGLARPSALLHPDTTNAEAEVSG